MKRVICFVAAVLALVMSGPSVSAEEPVAGLYTLRAAGNMESELELQENGRFQGQFSLNGSSFEERGRWFRKRGDIVLTTDQSGAHSSRYLPPESFPWADSFDALLEDLEDEERKQEVAKHCPYLLVADESSSLSFDLDKPLAEVRVARAEASLISLQTAKEVLESSMQAAVEARIGGDKAHADRLAEAAREAMRHYFVAFSEATKARLQAEREPPRSALQYPQRCLPRSAARANSDALPSGGYAVSVMDHESVPDQGGIEVIFEFDDGTIEIRRTTAGGWALLRRRADARLSRIGIRPPVDGMSLQFFAPPSPPDAVLMVRSAVPSLPSRLLDGARLRRVGRDLIWNGKARYVRE